METDKRKLPPLIQYGAMPYLKSMVDEYLKSKGCKKTTSTVEDQKRTLLLAWIKRLKKLSKKELSKKDYEYVDSNLSLKEIIIKRSREEVLEEEYKTLLSYKDLEVFKENVKFQELFDSFVWNFKDEEEEEDED